MKQSKYLFLLAVVFTFGITSCKKQLDVKNPNSPSLVDAQTESGIISLAKGAVYFNGFNVEFNAGLNQLGSSFFYTGYGYQELMADVISASASNQNINVINLPEYVVLDNGTKVSTNSSQRSTIRITNTRSNRSSNSIYYEWAYMYNLNNACNNILDVLPDVKFTGDVTSKRKAIEAWAYWWKGYAYSRIGSIYYAGLINNTTLKTNANFVTHDAMIAEANKNLDLAATALAAVTNAGEYTAVLTEVIPDFVQTGKGGVPTVAMFQHNINTMKARNLLVNKKVSAMTAADWNTILTLTANGITSTDNVFTGRTTATNGFINSNSGSVAALTTGTTSTFRISERFIQEYKTGDKRLANNFKIRSSPLFDQTGGVTFSTRYYLVDKGNGLAGVQVLSDRTPGNYELYIGPTYEENALMRAEALIYTNQIEAGLALVDAVRNYQGAGIAAVAGTGLSQAQAITELRRERRVALVFRGVSYYDYRRWGYTYDVAQGGGRTGAVVLTVNGQLNTNATINYNFLDYWDVPADETELNPPATGSAPTTNPG